MKYEKVIKLLKSEKEKLIDKNVKEKNIYVFEEQLNLISEIINVIDLIEYYEKIKSLDSKLKHDLKSINKKLHEPGVCIYRYYRLKGMKTKTQEILKYLQKPLDN